MAGSQRMMGELRLDLRALTGRKNTQIVHVASIPENVYDVIIGMDILRLHRGYPRYHKGQWRIKTGRRSFRADGCAETEDLLGVTLVGAGQKDEALDEEVVGKFKALMYREGEPLSATGKVEHHIDLIGERPVYVKPRRYPQAYEEVIRDQITEMLQEGLIRLSIYM
jgi:hypothetical protein